MNEKWNVTRYEHSIGVMLLIKRLGGSIEEQIAGLLHDVSHTAFSHVIDFVLYNKQEDYHEKVYRQFIMASDIPDILTRYGYDVQDVLLDDDRWTLLEQPAPDLCADRIDSTLRDMYRYGNITAREIQSFLKDLIVMNDKIHINNLQAAEWFVKTYYMEVIDFFLDPLNVYGYNILSTALETALNKHLITLNTLHRKDEEVMVLLRSLDDQDVTRILQKLHPDVVVTESKDDYDVHFTSKMRLIDPSIPINGQLIRSSSLSKDIQKMNESARQKAKEGMYVKVHVT